MASSYWFNRSKASLMKYCQGTKCHQYRTKDRIRGTKGNRSYQTRRRSSFYYGNGNFCSTRCQEDWLNQNIESALNHFGRTTEPKILTPENAWVKDYDWHYDSNHRHYFVNDLTKQRIAITKEEYDNVNLVIPNNLSR